MYASRRSVVVVSINSVPDTIPLQNKQELESVGGITKKELSRIAPQQIPHDQN